MHREIQIKQFPIVHWWPKTRNERFVWENEQYLYRLYPGLAQTKPERAHTHVTHRMCVCTQITWTWLCTRGKKRYKYCSFSHTNRSFRVLGHQCVVTMGNCLIWISLCMFFFPLIETVTYTCHYMTDRLERFDLKTSKLDLLKKKRHYILDALGVSWYIPHFNFKVNYPFKWIVKTVDYDHLF